VYTADGTKLATTINEMARDNGDYWMWKSSLKGDGTLVPDHTWSIIWRPDLGRAFRQDLTANHCYNTTFDKQLLPYDWILSKTYGILWFDELIDYEGKEATLYSAAGVGNYGGMDFETQVNFYITNEDGQIVNINGTLTAHNQGIEVFLVTESLSYEHNIEIAPKTFSMGKFRECGPVDLPAEPTAEWKGKCYEKSSSASITLSWIAVLAALLAILMNF